MGEPAVAEQDLQVSYVPMESLEYVWSSQLGMIEKAMTKGQGDWATSDEILGSILDGSSQLWTIHRGEDVKAVVVVGVKVKPLMTKLFVRMIAGTGLDEWAGLLIENLKRFQEVVGADCIEASCRPGLAKYLQKIGWSQKAVIVELK